MARLAQAIADSIYKYGVKCAGKVSVRTTYEAAIPETLKHKVVEQEKKYSERLDHKK